MTRHDHLFISYDLRAVLEGQMEQINSAVTALDDRTILNTAVDELCDDFVERYTIRVPRIRDADITVDQSDTKVDVSGDRDRFIGDRNRPFLLSGTEVVYFVPFDGDSELFNCQPSTFDYNPPRAAVHEGELCLSYTRTDHNAESVKKEFERDLTNIKRYLDWQESQISGYNEGLRETVKSRIEARREKLLKDQDMVSALGFPVRRRENAPATYAVPQVRRTVRTQRKAATPPSTRGPIEPALDMTTYEEILSIMSNMVTVMERSPQAFQGMKEEDIRQHFLVQLNGQFEGQATGETFNAEGKTDILIRVEGKNIFIAECKFWKGQKAFLEAIDQLFRYTTWRDTKCALIVFNRGKNLSQVLKTIREAVRAHPQFKRELTRTSETGFRYNFSFRDDAEREMIMTVLVFDLPTSGV